MNTTSPSVEHSEHTAVILQVMRLVLSNQPNSPCRNPITIQRNLDGFAVNQEEFDEATDFLESVLTAKDGSLSDGVYIFLSKLLDLQSQTPELCVLVSESIKYCFGAAIHIEGLYTIARWYNDSDEQEEEDLFTANMSPECSFNSELTDLMVTSI